MRPPAGEPACSSQLLLAALCAAAAGAHADPPPARTPSPCGPSNRSATAAGSATPSATAPTATASAPAGLRPRPAEIREDLLLMLPHWNLLRIYGSSGFAETLLAVIRDDGLDMKVMLGRVDRPGRPAAANRREIEAAIRLAAAYPDIVLAVSVGNETQVSWSAHRCPLDVLIAQSARVRARRRRSRSRWPTTSTSGTSPRAGRWPPRSTSSPCTRTPCGTACSWTTP